MTQKLWTTQPEAVCRSKQLHLHIYIKDVAVAVYEEYASSFLVTWGNLFACQTFRAPTVERMFALLQWMGDAREDRRRFGAPLPAGITEVIE